MSLNLQKRQSSEINVSTKRCSTIGIAFFLRLHFFHICRNNQKYFILRHTDDGLKQKDEYFYYLA